MSVYFFPLHRNSNERKQRKITIIYYLYLGGLLVAGRRTKTSVGSPRRVGAGVTQASLTTGRQGGLLQAGPSGRVGVQVLCPAAHKGQRQGHALPHVVCLCLDARLDNDGSEWLILHSGWTFHSEVVLEAAAGNKKIKEHTPCKDEYILFLSSTWRIVFTANMNSFLCVSHATVHRFGSCDLHP